MITLALLSLGCALLPAVLLLRNLRVFPALPHCDEPAADVAILIPARDEAENITAAVEAALLNRGAEVLVLDDDSSDATASLVRQIASREPRVRLLSGAVMPPGWRGKNWACAQLAAAATRPLLLFVDADVRLAPEAAATIARWMRARDVQLASGVPFQEVGTFTERLIIPLIHFVLLGFLPLRRMRKSRALAYGAGCGQLLMVAAASYRACGGHQATRERIHDGLALPRVFRSHGFRTDLFDGTDLASCRMYYSAEEVWRGFIKNAHEGLGAPVQIVPATVVLLLGQVAPFFMLAASRWISPSASLCAVIACAIVLSTRVTLASRFRQRISAALLHPIGIVALLVIQWTGLIRWTLGKPARWKSRDYVAASARDRVPATNAGEHFPERIEHALD